MDALHQLYRDSLALLTDLYQLTMAYSYWKSGLTERQAVFHLFFRKPPFDGGYALACGLEATIEFLRKFHFRDDDVRYLATLHGNDDQPLFEREFLEYLSELTLTCDVDAVPEGTPVFPHEPLVRVQGPILECQLLETPLLNLINFPTLVATKAARVCRAAQGDAVIEFGLRRAQGIDGGITAARAAVVGGCVGTSNVLAGKLFDIPVLGTHAHSWVMCFETEREAFETYAHAMPNNCVFLVDTYESLQGVRNAVEVSRKLKEQGHRPVGIRLDSGDLAELSIQARILLDDAGLEDVQIVGSGDLDEYRIQEFKRRGARVDLWGVGTHLTTAYDCPALGGVYKLSAVRDPGRSRADLSGKHDTATKEPSDRERGSRWHKPPLADWQHRIKLSDDPVKTTNPGIQQVRRFYDCDGFLADAIFSEDDPPQDGCTIVNPANPEQTRTLSDETPYHDLLEPVLREGRVVYDAPPLNELQEHARSQLARLPDEVKRLREPAPYFVGLEENLHDLKARLIQEVRDMLAGR